MVNEWEIAVIGGGPAGLSAALAAAEAGAQAAVLDAYPAPGGQYYRQPPDYLRSQPTRHQRQGRELWQKVQRAGIPVLSNTLAWYADASRRICYTSPEGERQAQAQALILACGAYERPVPFPGWTLPGVLMTGGAQTLLYQHVLPGKRVLLAGTGPLQLVVAKKLIDAGSQVVGVLEGNPVVGRAFRRLPALWGQWERLEEGAASYFTLLRRRAPYRIGWGIIAAHGEGKVEGATIARLDKDWRPVPGSYQEVACDTICTGFGFVPFNALSRQMGARQVWREALGGFVPERDSDLQTSIPGVYAAGDGAGLGGVRLSLIEGRIAGYAAAAQLGYKAPAAAVENARRQQRREQAFQALLLDLFTPGPGAYELAADDTLICRCEGVTKGKIAAAAANGAASLVELKADTRCGMGECQGRMCEHGVLHLLEQLTRRPIAESGGYHLRPPALPVSIGALSQASFDE
jgi:thioredoxin reductase/bacterioferritin-associated ferredoxin